MKYFKDCCSYLKDNPEGYWFKRKLYGWGWTPATWQGWAILFVFIAYIMNVTINFVPNHEPNESELIWFFAKVFGSVAILLVICYKTGESPKWMWGLPEKGRKNDSKK